MIDRDDVMSLLLASSPAFADEWDPAENLDDDSRLLYLDVVEYVRHVLRLIRLNAASELTPIFEVIERLHVEGDDQVRELATVGILEGLQSAAATSAGVDPELEVRPYLLPVSLEWWERLNAFWNGDATALHSSD